MDILKGKTIIFGVTGGIAIYKAANIVSYLRRKGAKVHVVMTKHAQEFVKPLVFKTISENNVITDMFNDNGYVTHISLTQIADLFVVAPATANIIAKFSCGIADDMLSTMFLAYKGTILIVPSMNDNMYLNEVTKENLKTLKKRGIKVVEPVEGLLATGKVGKGRFPEDDTIIYNIEKYLYRKEAIDNFHNILKETNQSKEKQTVYKNFNINIIKNKKAIVTLGATREYIDPVRFISNPSSGKTGYFFAKYLDFIGFDLKVIAGNYDFKKVERFNPLKVDSTKQMLNEILFGLEKYDILIMSAAVSDFTPEVYMKNKIKKQEYIESNIQSESNTNYDKIKINNNNNNNNNNKNYFLKLKRTKDILKEVKKRNKDIKILGFAAETENIEGKGLENGLKKLEDKKLDAICINQVYKDKKGFQADKNTLIYIDRFNNKYVFENMSKEQIAKEVVEKFVFTFCK